MTDKNGNRVDRGFLNDLTNPPPVVGGPDLSDLVAESAEDDQDQQKAEQGMESMGFKRGPNTEDEVQCDDGYVEEPPAEGYVHLSDDKPAEKPEDLAERSIEFAIDDTAKEMNDFPAEGAVGGSPAKDYQIGVDLAANGQRDETAKTVVEVPHSLKLPIQFPVERIPVDPRDFSIKWADLSLEDKVERLRTVLTSLSAVRSGQLE